jgi:hypothetical protein
MLPPEEAYTYFCKCCTLVIGTSRGQSQMDALNRWCPNCMRWENDTPPQDMHWLCNDWRVLRVSEMETNHINHSIRRIWTVDGWRGQYMELLIRELERRQDNAGSGRVDGLGAGGGQAAT